LKALLNALKGSLSSAPHIAFQEASEMLPKKGIFVACCFYVSPEHENFTTPTTTDDDDVVDWRQSPNFKAHSQQQQKLGKSLGLNER